MTPLRLIFAGSGEFGLPTLRALRDAGHDIVQVITQPDRPAGRGRALTATPIGQFAIEANLPLLRTVDINAKTLPAADVMIVIAFGQKIAPHIVDHPRLGSVNLHASRLPKYRGAAPINWAILNGDRITGNSIIRLAQKMDAGAILGQSEIAIGEMETAGELHDRLADDGAPLMLRVIEQLASGTAQEAQQDHAQATLAPKLNRQATQIDWMRPARDIAHQIRGLYPWPGCRVALTSGTGAAHRLTLVRARAIDGRGGEIGAIGPAGFIATGQGLLEIIELQPEAKRPMPLAAYQNGHPWTSGTRVESVV